MTPAGGYNPFGITYWGASVFFVRGSSGGAIYDGVAHNAYGLRPVINLKADVTITGSGTMTDPYVVA